MKPPIIPKNELTVIIRDNSPMIFLQDTPTYRSVKLFLNDEQMEQLVLNYIGTSCGTDYFEEISKCFIEPREAVSVKD
jgi:hypothetical protein